MNEGIYMYTCNTNTITGLFITILISRSRLRGR